MLKTPTAVALLLTVVLPAFAQTAPQSEIDKDLMEVTIPQLQTFYAAHKYTVTQVVEWHLARIHRYNGIYRPVEQILEKEALATAAQEDAEAAPHGPLWGVPMVIKANTSIAGQVTTDGWAG